MKGVVTANNLNTELKSSLKNSQIDSLLAAKNIKRERISVANPERTYTVENNFMSPSAFFLYWEIYFTTPLNTPKEDKLIKIFDRFRICPTFAIPACPVYWANRF